MSKTPKSIVVVGLLSVGLFLCLDLLFGAYAVRLIKEASRQDSFRIENSIYHHGLSPSFKGVGFWGDGSYPVCTNSHGMKTSCDETACEGKQFDIAFIGDSFTEGIGLSYEQTFVGQVARQEKTLKIANLAVASYSPSIYFAKVKQYVEQGFVFKKLVVFVDISDIQDESVYRTVDGRVFIGEPPPRNNWSTLKSAISSRLPVLAFAKRLIFDDKKNPIRSSKIESEDSAENPVSNQFRIQSIYQHDYERSAWTYNDATPGYGRMGVNESVRKAVEQMEMLYAFLSERGIDLSVAVYPWPGTLMHDHVNSRQVKIWQQFCKDRCRHFYNLFDVFFAEAKKTSTDEVLARYFITGDVHLNLNGNRLVAKQLMSQGL
jgi:hypothetical protein